MTQLDITLLILIIVGLAIGYRLGFLVICSFFVSIVIGLYFTYLFGEELAETFSNITTVKESTAYAYACYAIILLSIIVGVAAAKLLTKIVKFVFLGWVNRGLGMLVAFIAILALEGFFLHLLSRHPASKPIVSQKNLQHSSLASPIMDVFTLSMSGWVATLNKAEKSHTTL